MLIGSAIHAYFLEKDKFDDEYLLIAGDRRKKEVKEAIAEAERCCKIVLSADEWERVLNTVAAIEGYITRHQIQLDWIAKEQPAFAKYDLHTMEYTAADGYEQKEIFKAGDTVVGVKCKPDMYGSNWIIDLKTSGSSMIDPLNIPAFIPYVARARMSEQLYHYVKVMEAAGKIEHVRNASILFAQSKPPHDVRMIFYTREQLEGVAAPANNRVWDMIRDYCESGKHDMPRSDAPVSVVQVHGRLVFANIGEEDQVKLEAPENTGDFDA
jgi:hypothetical protein